MTKLPVLVIARLAYAYVWENRRKFLALAFPAIVVLGITTGLFSGVLYLAFPGVVESPGSAPGESLENVLAIPLIMTILVAAAFLTMFAVAWHRHCLVAGERPSVRNTLRWGARQTRFLLTAIGLAVLVMISTTAVVVVWVVLSPSGASVSVLPAALMALVLSSYLYARFSVLFPATALDRTMGVRDAWAMTKGNGWRLLAIVLMAMIPASVAATIVQLILSGLAVAVGLEAALTANLLVALVDQTFTLTGTALGVTALSIAYRALETGARGGQVDLIA
ncbi:MAG: hypothetical protein QF902_04430 [Rhodospirillales bacterium]|nr:hypothetical protein [Rhodospirillales bacterium]